MTNLKSEMMVRQKRSEPLFCIHSFVSREHWEGIKRLAKQRDVTASELVRRLLAAELRRSAKPRKALPATVAPF